MNIRPTPTSALASLKSGLFLNLDKIVRAQEQIASGKRLLRISDDPAAATVALAYGRRLDDTERFAGALEGGRHLLDSAAARMQEVSEALVQARALVVQAMNGTLTDQDRATIAASVEQLRTRVFEVANDTIDGRYLFAGTATSTQPFVTRSVGGVQRVVYVGNGDAQQVQIGASSRLDTTIAGSRAFGGGDRTGTHYAGLTGIQSGTSADQGTGSTKLDVRHDATNATLGSGLALVNGGASDTLLGSHSLVVDAVAGTVQLDGGRVVAIPAAGAANVADVVVEDQYGAELHLDFTSFTGASYSGSVDGAGSVSLDGASYTPINFTETDLELIDSASGVVLHVDTTAVRRAGSELVVFGGAVNVFDTLAGIVDDLRNVDGLGAAAIGQRMELWLDELDANHDTSVIALGELGARSHYASELGNVLDDERLQLENLRAGIEDADLTSVALDLTAAQNTLALVQATSARMLSTSLLDFLG
jgi:flagellin-like hook-associated protein FlgL